MLTKEEIELLLESLNYSVRAVESGSASYELRREKSERIRAVMDKLREVKNDA